MERVEESYRNQEDRENPLEVWTMGKCFTAPDERRHMCNQFTRGLGGDAFPYFLKKGNQSDKVYNL